MQEKIGLMCGTFDPPHLGHLLLAQTALTQLMLDRVLFLPVGDPTHKTTGTAAEHRLNMTALAIRDNPDFLLDDTDATRPEPHYTATLIPLLQEKFANRKFWLLLGGDSLATLPSWYRPDDLLAQCRLAVLSRPGYTPDMATLTNAIPQLPEKLDRLDGPSISLSSTWLRQNLAAGLSPRYLIPPQVGAYIAEHELYR